MSVSASAAADPAAPVATRRKKTARKFPRTKAAVALGAPGEMTAIATRREGVAAATEAIGVIGVAIGVTIEIGKGKEIEMKGGRGASVPEAVRLLPGM